MDMQVLINTMNNNSKLQSAQEYNLGRFIRDLEKLDQEKLIYVEKGIGCDGLSSWRGSYCELAMQYDKKTKSKVKDVLKQAKNVLDSTLTGYKGGDFVMDSKTPIHIANYGEVSFEHKKYEAGMLYNDNYEPEKKDSKDNFMIYYQVKLIGIEDKGKYYQLKLRINDSSYEG